ncbi:hypothetical protein [Aquimarina sp. 2201CG5-10]|uniref:hypothetical protein n=1 Tax=Aquimarina callyspongiae TaxID=3098150 RepID=UPI002AB42DE8|nr:hypothetical protein [Aquimarina sp. 2201CG5-10]MDY8137574.1 hypothetical protein [Aquimarina sp. 2201CG5-10]
MSGLFNIGFDSSIELLGKIKRDRETLKNAIILQEQPLLKDSVMNFVLNSYSIKDWLKREGYSEVENYINDNIELRICADLCNGAKHKVLTSRRQDDDHIKTVEPSGIRASSMAYTAGSPVRVNSLTYEIQLESGRTFEILHFANRVIELWEILLTESIN